MLNEHYIEWISLLTNKGVQRKELSPEENPQAVFTICEDEEIEAVYTYCNLHSLWKNK